jgi:UDP-glucose 4-epimerase
MDLLKIQMVGFKLRKNMGILVTGGAGFIGSHLCEYLLNEGHRVVAIDNLSLGRFENISILVDNPEFKFEKIDILDEASFGNLFKKHDIKTIFHLAANSDIAQSHTNPLVDLNNTFLTTMAVLENARKSNIYEIIFASTSAIYGDTSNMLSENYGPLNPVSHYGAAKLASEGFLCSYAINYNIKIWIARFPNIIGEHATHGVIYDFINKLRINSKELEVLGNGEQHKPYLYVKELVNALYFIWTHSKDQVNIFNIGVNSRTKVKVIAEMVIKEMGLNTKINFTGGDRGWIGDVPEFRLDSSKLKKLGWRPKMTSDEAVKTAIKRIIKSSL